ncbi:MAG: hypothetical protein WA021_01220 [Minisyncoccia bacterium]
MRRFFIPALASLAVVGGLAQVRANAPQEYAMQMLGQPLEAVLHEARQMAFFGSETCWRELMPGKGALTKRHCQDLAKAADAYELARLAILRDLYAQKNQKK